MLLLLFGEDIMHVPISVPAQSLYKDVQFTY
jgi:hypothetical protein